MEATFEKFFSDSGSVMHILDSELINAGFAYMVKGTTYI